MVALHGVYSASVLDNRDPNNLARVLVRVSSLTDGPTEVWARVATMMAGQNRGTLFIPDVDDEVLVAFERGDIRAPYVIGAMWNATARPPSNSEQATSVKLIRSRNGTTLRILDDKDNNSIVIETPGGQRITLQDSPGSVRIDDAAGNSVTLSTSGVKVSATGVATITASAVELTAGILTIHAGMSRFEGVVQCDTLISNAVLSASYSPAAGN
jgi:uncharacterized protein involved in type VI secretion and phage assembly